MWKEKLGDAKIRQGSEDQSSSHQEGELGPCGALRLTIPPAVCPFREAPITAPCSPRRASSKSLPRQRIIRWAWGLGRILESGVGWQQPLELLGNWATSSQWPSPFLVQGNLVAVKRVNRKRIELTRKVLFELKHVMWGIEAVTWGGVPRGHRGLANRTGYGGGDFGLTCRPGMGTCILWEVGRGERSCSTEDWRYPAGRSLLRPPSMPLGLEGLGGRGNRQQILGEGGLKDSGGNHQKGPRMFAEKE